MEWQYSDAKPVFLQIAERLRERILGGVYPPGAQIPTVRGLAAELTVNPNTVQRALGVLEEEGLLYSNGTQGRFVTEEGAVLQGARAALCRRSVRRLLAHAGALGISVGEIMEIIKEESEHE